MNFTKYPKKFKEYGVAGEPKVNWKLDFCKVYLPCEKCTLTSGCEKCEYGKSRKWYDSLPTREQAIECIAKALEENLNGSSFNSLAEAALNALLEANNGK